MSPTKNQTNELFGLLKLGLPIMGTQLLLFGMVVTDFMIVGTTGEDNLAALGLSGSLYGMVHMLTNGIIGGFTPFMAEAFGAKRYNEIGIWFRNALVVGGVLALFLFFFVFYGSFLLVLLDQNQTYIDIADIYLKFVAWAIPSQIFYIVLRQICETSSRSVPIFISVATGFVCNIFLDYGFVHGLWGLPKLGIAGAGLATSSLSFAMCIGLAAYVFRSKAFMGFNLISKSFDVTIRRISSVLKVSLPSAAAQACEVLFFISTTFFVGRFFAHELAIHQIALNIASLVFMIPLGLSIAVCVRVGQHKGEGNIHLVKKAWKTGMLFCFALQSITAAFFLLFPEILAGLYSQDASVISSAVALIGIAALFQLSDGLQVVGMGALRGLKDTKIPFIVTLLSFWALGAPVSIGLSIYCKMNSLGVWIGVATGLTVAAIFHVWRFRKLSNEGL